ncbi:Acyl dehydratase [Burkholderia sp. 8Y]|uniref:acyl dehydratase n=1 Tax=Burkholderia sp. 8Y TaxID=2653133 RepID=UPI0012F4760E|nr:acyl dehydratase [Burkholderia sp. 8Y]VXC14486.1 Acyl dehydratase [Burkholderia sp. 8Y]
MLNGVQGIRACLGLYLGHSDWLEVDPATIKRFESLPDADFGEQADAFGSDVIPSRVALGLVVHLVQQVYVLENASNVAHHAVQCIELLSLPTIGSAVRVGATVKGLRPIGERWEVQLACVMECDATSEPVLRADVLLRFKPRPESSGSNLRLVRSCLL